MKITADTNVLVRAITCDDPQQSDIAKSVLASADGIALTLPTLCELVWVLAKGYGIASAEIAETVRRLINARTTLVNRAAVDAGLAMLEAGGDFADGVIAHEGRVLGADTFVSFDKKAVKLLKHQGESARLLS